MAVIHIDCDFLHNLDGGGILILGDGDGRIIGIGVGYVASLACRSSVASTLLLATWDIHLEVEGYLECLGQHSESQGLR